MYVLFDKTGAVVSTSVDRRPFTSSLPVDDVDAVVKLIDETTVTREHTADGRPLFVDKHGVPTTTAAGNSPYFVKTRQTREVKLSREPGRFTRADVLKFLEERLAIKHGVPEVMVVDPVVGNSRLVDLGVDGVVVHPGGVLAVDASKTLQVGSVADGELHLAKRSATVSSFTRVDRVESDGAVYALINDGDVDVHVDLVYGY